MPTIQPKPPLEIVETARSASPGGRRLHRLLRRSTQLLYPHRVYVMGLRALAQTGPGLEMARPAGWRFLLLGLDEPVAIQVSDGDIQLERGPYVASAARVMEGFSDEPKLSGATFEPRLLRIPEARIAAVWFTAPMPDEEDVIVPLDPAPRRLEPFHAYGASEFLDTASALARRKLDKYESAEEPQELGS